MRTVASCIAFALVAFCVHLLWRDEHEQSSAQTWRGAERRTEGRPIAAARATTQSALVTEAEHFLDAVPLSPDDAIALAGAGQSEAHARLRRVIVSSRYHATVPRVIADPLKASYLDTFREHPDETLAAIDDFRRTLPLRQHPMEHALLLDLARQLPERGAESGAIASEILAGVEAPVRPSARRARTEAELDLANSVTAETHTVAFAHEVLVEQASEQVAYEETLKAIEHHADPGLRRQMTAQYVQRYPERRSELLAELKRRGALVSHREPSPP